MSEVANEVVVLENLEKLPIDGDNPEGKHHHHQREVECKPGLGTIVMEPIALSRGKIFDRRERYVRTTDVDEKGRPIFRLEGV